MKLAMLRTPSGLSLAVKTDKGIVDVGAADKALKLGAPATTDAVINGGGAALKAALAKAEAAGGYVVAEKDAKFGPCVTAPGKIICVGLNYKAHAAETGAKIPAEPILFPKYKNTLNYHGGTIAVSKEPGKEFDHEVELVIVIGKSGRHISEGDALSHVYGYCTGQDFSEREQQRRSGQWMIGKTGDGWAPIGPWLVTADEVDAQNLKLTCTVNGKVRQSSNTNDMIFTIKQVVAYISKYMTLDAGDIIFTGTPQGVILGDPEGSRVWLKAGDKLVASIEGLGDLETTLV